MQYQLFEEDRYRPPVRRSDPETSHEGERHIRNRVSLAEGEFLRRLSRRVNGTAQEVAAGQDTLRKRPKPLVEMGLLEVAEVRICNRTGKKAQAYRLTEKGKQWIEGQ